ncbi:MAG: hypothetical protein ACK5MP_10465 [Nostocoides sp.]
MGTWQTVKYEESVQTDQGTMKITSFPRTLTIDAKGVETINYDKVNAQMTINGSPATLIFDGSVAYQIATQDGQMSFNLTSSKGTLTTKLPDGTEQPGELKPGTGAVQYTCSSTSMTEKSGDFFTEYKRVS